MKIMTIEDVMPAGDGLAVLTGPLLLKDIAQSSALKEAVGPQVSITNTAGVVVLVRVREVSASQAMSGAMQVSLGVELPTDSAAIAVGSVVRKFGDRGRNTHC